jgi:hypothetical protein
MTPIAAIYHTNRTAYGILTGPAYPPDVAAQQVRHVIDQTADTQNL